jgi:hypothetical protein
MEIKQQELTLPPRAPSELQPGALRHGLDSLSDTEIGQDVLAATQQRVEGDGPVVL